MTTHHPGHSRTHLARLLLSATVVSMLLCGAVAVWSNPDLPPPNAAYTAWVAAMLGTGFLAAGGWRVSLIALGGRPRYGDRVALGLCGAYAVAVLLYTARATLG